MSQDDDNREVSARVWHEFLASRQKRHAVTIVVEPDGDRFHAFCPALKGLHADGATELEAAREAAQAVPAYVASLVKHGERLPIRVDMNTHIRKDVGTCIQEPTFCLAQDSSATTKTYPHVELSVWPPRWVQDAWEASKRG